MNTLKAGLVAFGLVIGTAAMAQGRGDGKSPQERAQERTDWMAKELSLTGEQKTKVAELNLKSVEKNQAIRKDVSLSEEQKKEAWKTNRKAQKAQLKEILTAEQLAKLDAKREAFHAKHKQGAEGKHHDAKTPQERAQFRTDRMAKELFLTAEQKAKVAELNLSAAEKHETVMKDAAMTKDQKQAAMKKMHEDEKAQLKTILTAEQLKVLKAKKEEMHKHHKEHKAKK